MTLPRHPIDQLRVGGRLVLGSLFAYAAVAKGADLHAFAEEIANFQLVPPVLTPLVAALVPGVELVAGVLLIVGWGAGGAAVVLSGLLVVFTASLAQALLRGIDLRCGCFGSGGDVASVTWQTVGRDVALLLLAAFVTWAELTKSRCAERTQGVGATTS